MMTTKTYNGGLTINQAIRKLIEDEMPSIVTSTMWNEYCADNCYTDDIIYLLMGETLNTVLHDQTPAQVLLISSNHFCPADNWFVYNETRNQLRSANNAYELIEDMESFIEYLAEHAEMLSRYLEEDETTEE